jgi:hypothetical protein
MQSKINQVLVGRKIAKVVYMSKNEVNDNWWNKTPIVLILDDGTRIVPTADDECNDGGAMLILSDEEILIPTN